MCNYPEFPDSSKVMIMKENNDITQIEGRLENENVWLTQQQMDGAVTAKELLQRLGAM